jgi:gamma-glutamyltranspeptidase/glutathione hydrolase
MRLPVNNQLVRWQEKNLFFGGVHTVLENSEGLIEGAGDQRRDGVAVSC